jgi:hypothetical protein
VHIHSMHLLLSMAALAAASTEESSSSSSNLLPPSFTHPAFLPSSMRSSPTKSSIHGPDDGLSSNFLLHQPYESCPNSGLESSSNEPLNSLVYSALFMDAMQQELIVGQSAQHRATCSPNESMCDTDDVMGSSPALLTPLPILQRGWVLSGRDSNDDAHDRSFSFSSQSDDAERTTPRTTADHEGAKKLRTETKTTSALARHHHQQVQGIRQQSSPTHRLSFMVSNSLLWMVTMVRNAVLA